MEEIINWPEWYTTAFKKDCMAPHDLTDTQRLLSGMYELKSGQVFKASLFGRIEKGTT